MQPMLWFLWAPPQSSPVKPGDLRAMPLGAQVRRLNLAQRPALAWMGLRASGLCRPVGAIRRGDSVVPKCVWHGERRRGGGAPLVAAIGRGAGFVPGGGLVIKDGGVGGACGASPMAVLTLDDGNLGVLVVRHRVIGFVDEECAIVRRLVGFVDGGDNVLKAVGSFVGVGELRARARGLALESPGSE